MNRLNRLNFSESFESLKSLKSLHDSKQSTEPKKPFPAHDRAHFFRLVRTHRKLLFKLSLAAQIPAYIGALYRLCRKERGAARALLFVGVTFTVVSLALLFADEEKGENCEKTEKSEKTDENGNTESTPKTAETTKTENGENADEPETEPEAETATFAESCDKTEIDGTKADETSSYTSNARESEELARINEAIRILQDVEAPQDDWDGFAAR